MASYSKSRQQISWMLGEYPREAREWQVGIGPSKVCLFPLFPFGRRIYELMHIVLLDRRRPRLVPGVEQGNGFQLGACKGRHYNVDRNIHATHA